MKYISINQVEQNDKLGKNIFSNDGRVLLSKGSTLTIGLISRLKNLGVQSVYIIDEDNRMSEEEQNEEFVSEETKQEVLKLLSESFSLIQEGERLHSNGLSGIATHIISEIIENKDVMIELTRLKKYNPNLLMHSLRVAIMSILVGVKFSYTSEALLTLGMGALLHDVGKVYKGDEQKSIHHAHKGFHVLLQRSDINKEISQIVFQHHEFLDGTGNPRGMRGNDIHPYAKIIGVVNAYDNLITPVDGSESLLPCEAGEQIMGLAGVKYEYEVVWQFLRSVSFYPTGSNVRLSDGNIATIVAQNKGLPQRPIVRIFSDNTKDQYVSYTIKEINLANTPTLFINSLLMD